MWGGHCFESRSVTRRRRSALPLHPSNNPYNPRFLNEHPLCRPCAENGFTVAATEIDHIVPVKHAPDRFLDASNWQPICRPCHARKTATETRRRFMTPEQAGWQEPLMETASRGIAL